MRRLDGSAYCASCAGQYTDRVYVDLDSAWDGPVIDVERALQLDDLYLCAECIKEAAGLIDFDEEARVRELQVQHDILKRERDQALNYAGALEDVYDKRPEAVVARKAKRG